VRVTRQDHRIAVAVGDEHRAIDRCDSIATAAATLKSKLAGEDTPLTEAERALMQQWLTTLADAPTATPAPPRRGRERKQRDA
jgi:hypothetical protein